MRLIRLVLLVSVFSGLLGVFTPEARAELWEIDGVRFPGLFSNGRNLFYNQSGYYRALFIKSDGQLIFSDGVEATAAIPSALAYYRAKPISHPGVNAFLARTAPPSGPPIIPIPPPVDPSGYRLVSSDPAFSKLYTDGKGMFFKDGEKYRAVTFDRKTNKILFDGKDEASAEAIGQIIALYKKHPSTDTTVLAMLEAYKDKIPPKPDPAKPPKLTLVGTTHPKGSDVKLDFTQENIPSGTILNCTMTFPKLLRAGKPFVLTRNINTSNGMFGFPDKKMLKSLVPPFLDSELTGKHDYSLECTAKVGDQVVTAKKDGLVLDMSLLPGTVEPPKPKELAITGADILGDQLVLNIEHPGDLKPDTKFTCTLLFPEIERALPQKIEIANVGLDGKIQLPPWRELSARYGFSPVNAKLSHKMTVQCETPDGKKTNVKTGLILNPSTLKGYPTSSSEPSITVKNVTLDPKTGRLSFEHTEKKLPGGVTALDCTMTFTGVRKGGELAKFTAKVPLAEKGFALPTRQQLRELGFEGDALEKPAAYNFMCSADGGKIQSASIPLILDPKTLKEDGAKKETLTIKARKSDATHLEIDVETDGFLIDDGGLQCTLDFPTAGAGGKPLSIKVSGDKTGKLKLPDKAQLELLGFDKDKIKGKHAYSMQCTANGGKFTSNKLADQTLDLTAIGGPDAPKVEFEISGTEIKDGKLEVKAGTDIPADVKKFDCVMSFTNVKSAGKPIEVAFTVNRADGKVDFPWMALKKAGFSDDEASKVQPTEAQCSATVSGKKVSTAKKAFATFDPKTLNDYAKRPTLKVATAKQNGGKIDVTTEGHGIPGDATYKCSFVTSDGTKFPLKAATIRGGAGSFELPTFADVKAKIPAKDKRHAPIDGNVNCFFEYKPEGATEPITFGGTSTPAAVKIDPKQLAGYDASDAPAEKPDPKAKKCAVVAIGKEHLANEENSATFTMAVDAALLVRGLAAKGYEVTVLKPEGPSSYIDLTGGKVKKTLEGWNEEKLLKEVKDMGTRGCTVADVHINSHGCATSTNRYTVKCDDRCDTDPRKPSFLTGGDNGKDVCWGCATGKKGDMLMNSDALIDALAELQKGAKKPKTLLAADSCHAGRVFSNKWREHMKDEDFKNNVCVIAAGNGGVVALNNPNANISRIHRNFFFNCEEAADRTAIKDALKKMPDDLLTANKESLKKEITARLEKLDEFKDRDTKDDVKTAFEKKLEAEIERVLKEEDDGRVGRVDRVCPKLGPSKPGTTILDAFLDGVRTDRTNSAQISSFYGTKAEKYFFSDRTMSTYVALNDLQHYRNEHFKKDKAEKELTRLRELAEKGYPVDLLDASFLPDLKEDTKLRGDIKKAWDEYKTELEKLKALFEAAKDIKADTKDEAEKEKRTKYFDAVEALKEKFADLKKKIDGAVPATDAGKTDLKKTLGIKPTDACESRKLD